MRTFIYEVHPSDWTISGRNFGSFGVSSVEDLIDNGLRAPWPEIMFLTKYLSVRQFNETSSISRILSSVAFFFQEQRALKFGTSERESFWLLGLIFSSCCLLFRDYGLVPVPFFLMDGVHPYCASHTKFMCISILAVVTHEHRPDL